jgi:arginyl-tRNA synthetase
LSLYEIKIKEAAKEYSPAVIANYAFELAKEYNKFYQNIPIFSEADQAKLKFRIAFLRRGCQYASQCNGLIRNHCAG